MPQFGYTRFFFVLLGHYVVICGYDAGADEFEIRDPATSRYFMSSFLFLIDSLVCVPFIISDIGNFLWVSNINFTHYFHFIWRPLPRYGPTQVHFWGVEFGDSPTPSSAFMHEVVFRIQTFISLWLEAQVITELGITCHWKYNVVTNLPVWICQQNIHGPNKTNTLFYPKIK